MTAAWDLLVSTEDITTTELREAPLPEPGEGEVVLAVSRAGVTANNVTYAVLGDTLRYWRFFPAPDGWGRVPLWGFADVVASRAEGVTEGQRLYGYLPTSSHLLVRPDRVGPHGFRDAAAHRSELSAVYNAYALTTGDRSYDAAIEDLQVLYRPLFTTSFALAAELAEGGARGAGTVVLSSASSKTAYGTAFLLQGGAARVVGLTSVGNRAFVEALGCYDEVLTYDEVDRLPLGPTAYVDAAGDQGLRERLHDHLREHLVLDLILGVTHQDTGRAQVVHGARPTQFFAPDVIRDRTAEWGRAGFEQRLGQAWARFVPRAREWVDVVPGHGPAELAQVWAEVAAGRAAPRTGHVLTF
jgi:NADPH:quinone reductase-like Zn-dependent oxidoreductase